MKKLLYLFVLITAFFPKEIEAFEDKIAKSFMNLYEVKQGVLAHDRGWFGKNREGFGPDYNFELMFNSLKASSVIEKSSSAKLSSKLFLPELFTIIIPLPSFFINMPTSHPSYFNSMCCFNGFASKKIYIFYKS